MIGRTLTVLAVAAGLALPARARTVEGAPPALDGLLVVGAGTVPEYEGSAARSAIPLLGVRLARGHRYANLLGTTLEANLVDRPDVEFGPVLGYAFGRDDAADSDVVAALDEIDPTIELGAFAAWHLPTGDAGSFPFRLEARLLGDVGGVHDGWRASVGASRTTALAPRWLIDAGASLSFVDGGYADTWFSVSRSDAAASGLERHTADGGLHDVGASLDVRYLLGERASLGARVAWRRLLGDAADSPIVSAEGDVDQVLAALSLGWRF